MVSYLRLTDHKQRDAKIIASTSPKPPGHSYQNESGQPVRSQRFIKATQGHTLPDLLAQHGDLEGVGQAVVNGDPEIDLELVGRKTGPTNRVWIGPEGKVLYTARYLEAIYEPDGTEKERRDFIDVEATVNEEDALLWSGRLFPVETVVQRFVLSRKLQLRHVDGLTFDFLFDIARTLHDKGSLLFVGSGTRGTQPLIFMRNGSPYRGFLEGRIDGDGYLLVLHLSNLELKGGAH